MNNNYIALFLLICNLYQQQQQQKRVQKINYYYE